jgi:hypothetical protein
VPVTTDVATGAYGIEFMSPVGTAESLLPSIEDLMTEPSVVHVRIVPTSGVRKKFSAAVTCVAVPPTADAMYELAGAVAEIDE